METSLTASSSAAHFQIAASKRIVPKVTKRTQLHCRENLIVRSLLADDQLLSGFKISATSIGSGRQLDAQQLCNLSVDNQSSTYVPDYPETSGASSSRTIGVGGASVAGFSVDCAAPLIAVELLTSTVVGSSTAGETNLLAVPSTDLSVAAAAVSVIRSGTRNQPDIATICAIADPERLQVDRTINALMVGAATLFAAAKILTVDHDYWHGWTLFEILRYAPVHNWNAYEKALQSNPVLAKMMISGIVYSLGDWIAQCYEGTAILDFKRERVIRSGLVGFCLHGSLSHYYYYVCEALFPFKEWWVVPLKVAFDQTIWSGFWNSVYYVVLGLLRLESPFTIASELKATFWPLLTAGWKLWPFAHLVTYGLVPTEQRLLWVDIVELVWVTILSMYSNKKLEVPLDESSCSIDNHLL